MKEQDLISCLKVLIALGKNDEAELLRQNLEYLGHRVQICLQLDQALRCLREWQPDLVITEERLAYGERDAGLHLAEYCRANEDQINGRPGTKALVFIPIPDWDRFRRVQETGAHVIVKSPNFDAIIRYVQTIADSLTTDRILGPTLFGIHRFRGGAPQRFCSSCEWVGASLSYGTSLTDVPLTTVRATLFNSLLFRRRGLSTAEIDGMIDERRFLKSMLKGKALRQSAIKMEITRLRRDVEQALRRIGAPYGANHFLPIVPHGFARYRLAGNWHLSHVPSDV
jgi:CheY-like chemotaxis protein